MDDRISIIVSTFKRKEKLRRLLESFSRLSCRCPFEIILVDSASGDGTEELVKSWIPAMDSAEVIYHLLPERVPPARARNIAITLSTGNILAFTDDDCAVDPAWLDTLYAYLISHPEYDGAGGHVLPMGDDIFSRYHTVYRVLDPPRHINAVVTANCMIRKQPVADAGLFDEYFVVSGGEETALCMKLWLRGSRFGYEEKAVVYHDYRKSLRNFMVTFFLYGNGEWVIYTHNLPGYLRYFPYPEKICNNLGFANRFLFLLFFVRDMVYGIACQYRVLGRVASTFQERLMLNGLYAIHHFAYHLGRGTFSATLAKTVKKYRSDNPGSPLPQKPDQDKP